MVLAEISLGGRAELVLLDRFLSVDRYVRNILEPVVAPCTHNIDPDFILMHDIATSHTTRVTRNFIEEQNIRVLDWPAQSPDLNPIEDA